MSRKLFKIDSLSIKNGSINFSEEDLEKIRKIFIGSLIQHHYMKYKNTDIKTETIRFNLIEHGKEFITLLDDNMKFFNYDFTLMDLFKLCNQLMFVVNQQYAEEI